LRVENATFANGTDRLALESPRADLTLHLRSGPALTGRFVCSPSAPPGLLQYSYQLFGERGSNGSWRYTSLEGRFRAPIPGMELGGTVWAALLVEADARGYLYQRLPSFEAARGLDAGDLPLEPVRSVSVRVRDGLGKPLAGAVARVVGPPPSWARASAPADELGETTLRFVPERTTSLRVSALRFADRSVEVGPFGAPEVVLAPLASLEVERAGDAPGGLTFESLVVHATEPIYGDGDESEIEQQIQVLLGATQPLERSRGPGPGSTNRIVFRSEPRYLLTGLRPGVPLQVEARAADESVLWRRVLTLAPEEWARVEIPRGP